MDVHVGAALPNFPSTESWAGPGHKTITSLITDLKFLYQLAQARPHNVLHFLVYLSIFLSLSLSLSLNPLLHVYCHRTLPAAGEEEGCGRDSWIEAQETLLLPPPLV